MGVKSRLVGKGNAGKWKWIEQDKSTFRTKILGGGPVVSVGAPSFA